MRRGFACSNRLLTTSMLKAYQGKESEEELISISAVAMWNEIKKLISHEGLDWENYVDRVHIEVRALPKEKP